MKELTEKVLYAFENFDCIFLVKKKKFFNLYPIMGCTISHAQPVRPARVIHPLPDYDDEPAVEPPPTPTLRDLLRSDVCNITQGLKRLTISRFMRPVMVVGENSYPLVLASFGFDDDVGQGISLPVIAISRVGSSRIVFFGDYQILTDGTIANNDFFENLLSWATSFKYANKLKICLMGETQSAELSGFSITLTNCDILPPPNTFDIIFTTNTVDADYSRLINNSTNTAIFYFATDGVVNPIKECGVSIAPSSLTIRSVRFRPNTTDELDKHTFQTVSKNFIDFVNKITQSANSQEDQNTGNNANTGDDKASNSNLSDSDNYNYDKIEPYDSQDENKIKLSNSFDILRLDSNIIALRYYIRSIEGYDDICDKLAETCWNYLKSTKFRTDDGNLYFTELDQSLFAMILSELFSRVHPQLVTAAPYIKVPDVPIKSRKFRLPLRQNAWNYTGHYLLPGFVGTITSDAPCTIQIGSNALQLFIKQGPWKRYPTITHRVSAKKDEEVEVASPFGGICYILSDETISINISLTNFTMYPCFSYKKPDLWSLTCKYDGVPCGEFSCKGITFVMPIEKIKNIEDKQKVSDVIGRLITVTNGFVGPKLTRSHRVVFEIDMPSNEPIFDEVLYVSIKDCDYIINNNNQPTNQLLVLLSSLVFAEIDSAFLCQEVELTFSKVAAAAALNSEWEENEISNNATNDNQKAYNVLLSIAIKYGYKPFAAALKEVIENPNIKTGYEAWEIFCRVFVKMTDVRPVEIENLFWEVRKLQGKVSTKLMDFLMPEENMDE